MSCVYEHKKTPPAIPVNISAEVCEVSCSGSDLETEREQSIKVVTGEPARDLHPSNAAASAYKTLPAFSAQHPLNGWPKPPVSATTQLATEKALWQHYLQHTSQTLADAVDDQEKLYGWRVVFPRLGLKYACVPHSIHAVSAMCLYFDSNHFVATGESKAGLIAAAEQHYGQALAMMQAPIDAHNADNVLAASCLLQVFDHAYSRFLRSQLRKQKPVSQCAGRQQDIDIPSWMHFQRGIAIVKETIEGPRPYPHDPELLTFLKNELNLKHLPRPKVGFMGRLCATKGVALTKLSTLLNQLLQLRLNAAFLRLTR